MPDIKILENTIYLSSNIINLLQVIPGDRLKIGYIEKGKTYIPIIQQDDNGNKLSKTNTFIFKGNDRDILLQYGDEFIAEDDFGTIILHGNKQFTKLEKSDDIVNCYLDPQIMEDTNYNIQKFEKYEL